MAAPILSVRDLKVSAAPRGGARTAIVDGVSFELAAGEVLALIGESGSGKTTISLACMGYARAGCEIDGGNVILGGRDLLALDEDERRRLRGDRVAYVAPSAAAEMPVLRGAMTQAEADRAAVALYRTLELPDPERIGERYPHQVSGGQLQRLMAAMAMMSRPDLLILDEPTTALDVTTQIEVLHAFKMLVRHGGNAALYVSHDLSLVAQIADRILVLKDGRTVEHDRTGRIIAAPSASYTRQLIAAAHTMPASLPAASPSAQVPLVSVRGVSAGYGTDRSARVLHAVDLDLMRGETLGLIGESGSGKTTLGRVISGLMSPTEGNVTLEGTALPASVRHRTKAQLCRVQFVFQQADVALNPRQKLEKILGRPFRFFHGASAEEARSKAAELLERVGMPARFVDRYPSELSGGQRQRVNLARALAAGPDVLICDEITSALDSIVAQQIRDLLEELQRDLGLSYLFITHDIATVARICDRVAVMHSGTVVDSGTTAEVISPPFHPYTELLLRSVPEMRSDWLDTAILERRRLVANLAARNLTVND